MKNYVEIQKDISVAKGGIHFYGALVQGDIRWLRGSNYKGQGYTNLQVCKNNYVVFSYSFPRMSQQKYDFLKKEFMSLGIIDKFGESIIKEKENEIK